MSTIAICVIAGSFCIVGVAWAIAYTLVNADTNPYPPGSLGRKITRCGQCGHEMDGGDA